MSQDETNAKLESKLAQISTSVYESSPELRDLIDKVSNGELDEQEALTQMMQVVVNTDALSTTLQTFADEAMGELKATNPAIKHATIKGA